VCLNTRWQRLAGESLDVDQLVLAVESQSKGAYHARVTDQRLQSSGGQFYQPAILRASLHPGVGLAVVCQPLARGNVEVDIDLHDVVTQVRAGFSRI